MTSTNQRARSSTTEVKAATAMQGWKEVRNALVKVVFCYCEHCEYPLIFMYPGIWEHQDGEPAAVFSLRLEACSCHHLQHYLSAVLQRR